MGLDTSHNCWHGSYGSFKRFRGLVAEAAKEHYGYEPDYDAHPFRAYMGWWDFEHEHQRESDWHPLTEPLDGFFIHSDCDGWIFPHHAGLIADRLEPLVGYLDDGEPAFGQGSPRAVLRQFIAGLREAWENGDVVGFH